MVDRDLARTIVGIIGNVISMGLFLSPAQTFFQIIKSKSVQKYKPLPYLATTLNCAMWVFYGMPFVHPGSTLVVTINGAGFVLEIIYVTIFFIYSPFIKWKKMIGLLAFEVVAYAIVVVITLNWIHGTHGRTIFVGAFCVVLNILMYVSPLGVMKTVIRTKSVKYMPFWLSLATFCNGVVWLCYALIKFDLWIAIPNGLGTISGVIQLALYAKYYKSTNWEKTVDSNIEVPNVSNP